MLKVRGNVVTFNRGDDICLKINVYDSEGQLYELQEGDALYFSANSLIVISFSNPQSGQINFIF